MQSFEGLNKLPDPKKPSFQMIVDHDYILKQIPTQFVATAVPTFVLTLFAAIGKLFTKPKVKSLEEHNASF